VEPATKAEATLPVAETPGKLVMQSSETLTLNTNVDRQPAATRATGTGNAIIGGGCCVQLSVEYMPVEPVLAVDSSSDPCGVTVEVLDSEGCLLTWRKTFMEGYHVKDHDLPGCPAHGEGG
jgi:hypothetical protein